METTPTETRAIDRHVEEPADAKRRCRRTGLTPGERALRSRLAAYSMHARHDPFETTRAARDAFFARFEREVDPDSELPERERRRRAVAARKAYFARLALRSAKARRLRSTEKR